MPSLPSFSGFFKKKKTRRRSARPDSNLGGATSPGSPQSNNSALYDERELVTGLTSPGPLQVNTSALDGEREPVTAPPRTTQAPGLFYQAQNTTLNNAVLSEYAVFNEYKTGEAEESTAIKTLRAHTDPNAAVDSSARHPLPTCHPKTRREIRNRLTTLFDDLNREYLMAWLSGAAGSGKTAVGQTFSMKCDEKHRLGAAFFFSRPNGRNRYETVVPTLAYQLTVHCPSYRAALITRIDKDHQIFNKAPPIQFKRLIVEPLLQVRSQITTTFLMLLDGVDECGAHPNDAYEREREQQELIKMITDSVRDHRDLPLFWLFCSRPEQHLRRTFADVGAICRHEELVIDAKCREEVEVVLRDGFAKIAKDREVIPPEPDGWPSKEEFDKVERAVSGLHVFGAAILRDIEYSDSPVHQLKSLIPFLERVTDAGSSRSIAVMDLFYIRILQDVPIIQLPTTLKIIGALITMPHPQDLPAQALCNLLRLDPNDFFSALRKVHSVISVPAPKSLCNKALHFYHASFSDFLTNASRSGNFFIETQKAMIDLIKLFFFWHQLHSNLFHSFDRPFIYQADLKHNHDPLPLADLKWITSAVNRQVISDSICGYTEVSCFSLFEKLSDERNDELLSFVHDIDLRHMSYTWNIVQFLKWVSKHDPLSGYIRTKPENDVDRKLLAYLETVTKGPIPPTSFPVDWGSRIATYREYLFIGRGELSIIVWATRTHDGGGGIMALNQDRAPDQQTIQEYENSAMYKRWFTATQHPKD